MSRSVVVCTRTRPGSLDSLDSDFAQEVYEWNESDARYGGIFIMLFRSQLFRKTLTSFLESVKEKIAHQMPELVSHGTWTRPEETVFMLAFEAGVFRFREVTEHLCAEDDYQYRIERIPLNQSQGVPITRHAPPSSKVKAPKYVDQGRQDEELMPPDESDHNVKLVNGVWVPLFEKK